MKKVISILLIIFLAVAGVFVYKELSAKAVIGDGLSARSKKFISSQGNNNTTLRDVDFANKKTTNSGKSIEIEGCYAFVMPFSVRFTRVDAECEVSYGTDLPRGTLIMYKRKGVMNSFDSIPGVTLRRQEKSKYKEESKLLNGKKYLLFTNTQDEQIINAFYFEPNFYFVVNFAGSTSENTKNKLLKLLETVEFK